MIEVCIQYYYTISKPYGYKLLLILTHMILNDWAVVCGLRMNYVK